MIRLPDETDEAAIARALHESFEYSLIRNVITQIDERLEGIISTKVEEEIVEANEEIEVEASTVTVGVSGPEADEEDPDVVPDLDDLEDAITEDIERAMVEEEPEAPPALVQPPPPAPAIREERSPEIKEKPEIVEKPPEPVPPTRPPAMASKADVDGPKPEVRLMKRNLEKKWLNKGDGV